MTEPPDVAPTAARRDLRKRQRATWVYDAPKAPPLSALMQGPEARRAFAQYWIAENAGNAVDIATHYALKSLPIDVCSRLGTVLGRYALTHFHPVAQERARANIRRLRPDLDPAQQELLYLTNCKNQGRLMTEFSVINRIFRSPGRIKVHNARNMLDEAARGPIIIVSMHLGNWEIAPAIMRSHGIEVHANYVPPKQRGRAWIADRVRSRGGLKFLPPGLLGMKDTYAVLRNGGAVSIFCDEGFQGRIRAPFFGRAPSLDCNMVLAVKLARSTGATLCPWYNVRTRDANFECFSLPPVALPPVVSKRVGLSQETVVKDIILLNSVIEPVIRRHLDQWYFLDNLLDD